MQLQEATTTEIDTLAALTQVQRLLNEMGLPAAIYDDHGRCLRSALSEPTCCRRTLTKPCADIWSGKSLPSSVNPRSLFCNNGQNLLQTPICRPSAPPLTLFCCLEPALGGGENPSLTTTLRNTIKTLLDDLVHEKCRRHASLTDTEQLAASLARSYEQLALLDKTTDQMHFAQPAEEYLRRLCAEARPVLGATQLTVAWAEPSDADGLWRCVGAGQTDPVIRGRLLELLRCEAGRAARHANRVFVTQRGQDRFARWPRKVHSVIVSPVGAADALQGALVGFNKQGKTGFDAFDAFDAQLANMLTNQIGAYLTNFRLYADMQELLLGSLRALTSSIDAKDPYTFGHSERVGLIARLLAERMGLDQATVQSIYLTGLLHDVGKIGVSEAVLCKPGRLAEQEFAQIKRHPQIGANILGGIRQMQQVAEGVLTHHERYDGDGYPQRLRGRDIPLAGRIVMLADSLDAMISDRTYARALPAKKAAAEIRRCRGAQFDPEVADVFLSEDAVALVAAVRRTQREQPLGAGVLTPTA